jgi:Fe-S-cluster-containing dehydrogenase component/CRP-like cAMP-binding protein
MSGRTVQGSNQLNAMNSKIPRPERWDQPFDPGISAEVLDELLKLAPFNEMDPATFNKNIPLAGILKNDCCLHELEKGDIIVREGDYGSSAFLILNGEALVSLKSLPASILGRKSTKPRGWTKAIAQLWTNSKFPETRDTIPAKKTANPTGKRTDAAGTHVFLHDIPRSLPPHESVVMHEGEIFGEISALTRTPRSATVVANSKMRLLEIRWQGFRELLKRNVAMRNHIEQLYREHSLQIHLRETELFKNLAPDSIKQLADAAVFETIGSFQWNQNFKSTRRQDISDRILSEPLVAAEGEYVNGLILIRNGFARLSRQHGDGHQTIAYLGKGQAVGLRELVHNWKTGQQRPWLLSLRAVGYVDVLRIPTATVEKLVLPFLDPDNLPAPLPSQESITAPARNRRLTGREETIEPGLMEFLVDKRFINGTQALVIDLDRCTRCDDCVRACAATHDNNPRFNRTGEKYDHWMVAQACMHCLDPVCMIGCPTGAIGRDRATGNVTINDQTCIGCSTCANSCPYNNIQMVEINDKHGLPIVELDSEKPIVKATKCDLCVDQLGGPACQRACPHDALVRINLSTTDAIKNWSER